MNVNAIQLTCSELRFGLDMGICVQKFYGQIYPRIEPNAKKCFRANSEVIRCAINCVSRFYSDKDPTRGSLFSKASRKRIFSKHNLLFWTAVLILPTLEKPLSEASEGVNSSNGESGLRRVLSTQKPYPHLHFIAAAVMGVYLTTLLLKGDLVSFAAIGSAVALQLTSQFLPDEISTLNSLSESAESALGFVADPKWWFAMQVFHLLKTEILKEDKPEISKEEDRVSNSPRGESAES